MKKWIMERTPRLVLIGSVIAINLAILLPAAVSFAQTVSFGAATDFTVGPGPYSVAIGDLNGDGKPDLAVANSNGSGTVSILLGAGTGAFGAATNFAVGTQPASVAMDGRYVAYASQSATLVPGDTNGFFDVFVADLVAGTTVRASVDGAGAQGNGASDFPALSADGQVVAFQSDAANLVAGDTNATSDAFVRDLGTRATIRVSVETGGAEGNGASHLPAVSSTGHLVAFSSQASSLAAGDTNGVEDVFVRQW